MEKRELYLSLGSNLGDRAANLYEAVRRLDEGLKMPHSAFSDLLPFPTWGFAGPDFLNCVVRYEIPQAGQDPVLFAYAVLDLAKRIEAEMGRRPEEDGLDGLRVYHSRPIDIDILFYGDLKLDEPRLTIPHKMMTFRDFVLVPLRQVASPALRAQNPGLFA